MLTRTLATLTLLLALTGGAEPTRPVDTHLDQARAAHRARLLDVDDVGCREAPPAPVPVAPPSCSDAGEGQP
jgi:hypothetical protein